METEKEEGQMEYPVLETIHQKLSQNPDLSEHNKQVLDDYFRKALAQGTKKTTLRDYASRFNRLAGFIDFKLDDPEPRDLETIVLMFNTDEIKKLNGEPYGEYSKNKFWKTIHRFYAQFIKRKDKGYNPDIDYEDLLEDLEIKADPKVEVHPERLPTPQQIKKVARNANSTRDKTFILFGWATGARIGELVETPHEDNEPLKWKDIEFREDYLLVKLDGKNGEREIPVRTSLPLVKRLWEESDCDLEDPVFRKQNKVYYCPECGSRATKTTNTTHRKRKYKCRGNDCGWKGRHDYVDKRTEPMTDNAARRVIERCTQRAGLEGEFDTNPHEFFRKARAMYKTRIGWSEHKVRGFFGWSETSDSPKHYIKCEKEDLEKALAEEFEGEVNYEESYDDEALKPVKCSECRTVNSCLTDLCVQCSSPLTETGEKLVGGNRREKPGLQQTIVERAEQENLDPEEFEKLLDRPFIEVVRSLRN